MKTRSRWLSTRLSIWGLSLGEQSLIIKSRVLRRRVGISRAWLFPNLYIYTAVWTQISTASFVLSLDR